MSAQQMMLGDAGTIGMEITVGTNGVSYGYNQAAPFGSFVGNANLSLLPAYQVISATTPPSGADFALQASASYSGNQTSGFNQVWVYNQSGILVATYTSASASYNAGSQNWSWGTGSSPVWTGTGIIRNLFFT